jgi:hypothetical protein
LTGASAGRSGFKATRSAHVLELGALDRSIFIFRRIPVWTGGDRVMETLRRGAGGANVKARNKAASQNNPRIT